MRACSNLCLSPLLDDKSYLGYLESFGKASCEILLPYRDVARRQFTLMEVVGLVLLEGKVARHKRRNDFARAACALSHSLERQLARTIDLVPQEEWRRTVPELGADKVPMLTTLENNNWPHLKKIFALAVG